MRRDENYWFSEAEPQRQLHTPPVARRGHFAKSGAGLLTRRVELRGRVHGAELRVVQSVVHLPTELELALPFAYWEVFEDGNVVIVEPWKRELRVVAVIPDVSARAGPLEYRGVKPLVHCSLVARQSGTSGLHDTGAAHLAASREVEGVRGREGDVRRLAGSERADTGNLPVVQHPL